VKPQFPLVPADSVFARREREMRRVRAWVLWLAAMVLLEAGAIVWLLLTRCEV
jgi:hypothetical protein